MIKKSEKTGPHGGADTPCKPMEDSSDGLEMKITAEEKEKKRVRQPLAKPPGILGLSIKPVHHTF